MRRAQAGSHGSTVLAIAMLGACSSPAPTVPHNAVTIAAPQVLRSSRLATEGLPAVASDGSRVVIAARENDGERGFPNLTLIVKDRRDRELARQIVMTRAEADRMLPDAAGNNPALDSRIAAANRWLAEQHRVHRLLPLAAALTVFMHPDLRISTADGVQELRIGAAWMPDTTVYGTQVCQFEPSIDETRIDEARRIAVIALSYRERRDRCPGAPNQQHVHTW